MQYYTKQQLQGAGGYSPGVRVGNWNEEANMQETKLKELLLKQQEGSLKLNIMQQRVTIALQPVNCSTVRNDDLVHFGDVLQLANVGAAAFLTCDIEDRDTRVGDFSCAVSATVSNDSVACNTFLIAKYSPAQPSIYDREYLDDALHYGQKLRIIANPMVQGETLDGVGGSRPLYLYSRPVGTTHFAKFSRHQLVALTDRASYDTVWQVVAVDPGQRGVSEGVQIMAGAPFLLQHCATKQDLCLENHSFVNDLGSQLEVSAHSSFSKGQKSVCDMERMGRTQRQLDKAEGEPNHWTFLTGKTVATLPMTSDQGEGAQALIKIIAQSADAGPGGWVGLKHKLLHLDVDGSGAVNAEDLSVALRHAGLCLNGGELQLLARQWPTVHSDQVDVLALVQAIEKAFCTDY
ncbi:hypothetical protein WJX77_012447 [Trebouxia sp. C0004]